MAVMIIFNGEKIGEAYVADEQARIQFNANNDDLKAVPLTDVN